MKVLKRLLIKLIVLTLTVCGAACARMGYKFYKESTAESALTRYLDALLNEKNKEAYSLLCQNPEDPISFEDYDAVVRDRKYLIFAGYHYDENEVYTDAQGNEQVDCHITYVNAEDDFLWEEDLTLRRYEKEIFGMFDCWKVLSEHCMFHDFKIVAVKDAEVYLNGSLLSADLKAPAEGMTELYTIPSIVPRQTEIVARHPALLSVEMSAIPSEEGVDFCKSAVLKESSISSCEALAIEALQFMYSASAKNTTGKVPESLALCEEDVRGFVKQQRPALKADEKEFGKITISDYQVSMELQPLKAADAESIKADMHLTCHYDLDRIYEVETQEADEEGNPIMDTDVETKSGELSCEFAFEYADGTWKIIVVQVPVI